MNVLEFIIFLLDGMVDLYVMFVVLIICFDIFWWFFDGILEIVDFFLVFKLFIIFKNIIDKKMYIWVYSYWNVIFFYNNGV